MLDLHSQRVARRGLAGITALSYVFQSVVLVSHHLRICIICLCRNPCQIGRHPDPFTPSPSPLSLLPSCQHTLSASPLAEVEIGIDPQIVCCHRLMHINNLSDHAS